VLPTTPSPAQAMARPAPEIRPAGGNHEHDEREGYRDTRNVEHVAKRIVRRRRLWRRRLLSVCDEHQTSGAISKRSCAGGSPPSIGGRRTTGDGGRATGDGRRAVIGPAKPVRARQLAREMRDL
jgi:hypothetical protein